MCHIVSYCVILCHIEGWIEKKCWKQLPRQEQWKPECKPSTTLTSATASQVESLSGNKIVKNKELELTVKQDHEKVRECRTESVISCIKHNTTGLSALQYSIHYYKGIIQNPRALMKGNSPALQSMVEAIFENTPPDQEIKIYYRCCLSKAWP